jgi:hypothetical protein
MRQAGTDNPLRPAGTEAYLESVLYYPTKPSDRNAVEVFDRLGVKWLVVPSRLAGPGLKLVHQGYVGVYERTGRAPRAAWTEPGDAGRVRHSISRFPGEWTLDVLVARPGLVVVSESFVRGWRLEGAPAGSRVVEAPGGLIGLALPAGNYPSVRLVYDPWTVKAGLGISLLALAGLFIFGLWRLERVRA